MHVCVFMCRYLTCAFTCFVCVSVNDVYVCACECTCSVCIVGYPWDHLTQLDLRERNEPSRSKKKGNGLIKLKVRKSKIISDEKPAMLPEALNVHLKPLSLVGQILVF